MKHRDFTSARAKEALLKDKDKYCGECCWFYGEDTDGYGLCPLALMESKRCDEPCTNGEFVSKEEMRHHMAVLLQWHRWNESPKLRVLPGYDNPKKELMKAVRFAYKYMKVFSKL